VLNFRFAFLAAFGNKETTIKRLRKGESNASDLPGGVLQRNNIHIAVCESGIVGETLNALRNSPKTASAKAKFILATDGQTLEAEDLASELYLITRFWTISEDPVHSICNCNSWQFNGRR
jgi:restriction-modification enzyme MmeI-like protein